MAIFARSRAAAVLLLVFVVQANVRFSNGLDHVELENGFLRLTFNPAFPGIDTLQADYDGNGHYGQDLLAAAEPTPPYTHVRRGIVLETLYGDVHSGSWTSSTYSIVVDVNTPEEVALRIVNLGDTGRDGNANVKSEWALSLRKGERSFTFRVQVTGNGRAQMQEVKLSAYMKPTALFGFFDRGVAQRLTDLGPWYFAGDVQWPEVAAVDDDANFLFSSSEPHRIYALGNGGCVDFEVEQTPESSQPPQMILVNRGDRGDDYRSAAHFLFQCGSESSVYNGKAWEARWPPRCPLSGTSLVTTDTKWDIQLRITPNNHNFPASGVLSSSSTDGVAALHHQAFMTGIYANVAGALQSWDNPGHIGPTISAPRRGYEWNTNFFDPDAFIQLSALVYSGDAYLLREARRVLDVTAAAINSEGEVPHHFDHGTAVWSSIAASRQSGPNCFWLLTCLQYVTASGDTQWLERTRPLIMSALNFLLSKYSSTQQLFDMGGPLWIDVFVRSGFTTDTNAMMVHLLSEFVPVMEFWGLFEEAARYRLIVADLKQAINLRLWKDDHYVTDWSPNTGVRDFVDYDSNLLAVAYGVADHDKARQVLARVDRGQCTHAFPTYVSERRYAGPDVYAGNEGDSDCTMARIAWIDGHARAAVGDAERFNQLVLGPIIKQVVHDTWMYERYLCDRRPLHHSHFVEYPAVSTMLLREVTYGIRLGITTTTFQPIAPHNYSYHVGNLHVDFSPGRVVFQLPLTSQSHGLRIFSMLPNTEFDVVTHDGTQALPVLLARSDHSGLLEFTTSTGAAFSTEVRVKGQTTPAPAPAPPVPEKPKQVSQNIVPSSKKAIDSELRSLLSKAWLVPFTVLFVFAAYVCCRRLRPQRPRHPVRR